jgi:hypothetical protein
MSIEDTLLLSNPQDNLVASTPRNRFSVASSTTRRAMAHTLSTPSEIEQTTQFLYHSHSIPGTVERPANDNILIMVC